MSVPTATKPWWRSDLFLIACVTTVVIIGLFGTVVTLARTENIERYNARGLDYWQKQAPAGWCVRELHGEGNGNFKPVYVRCEQVR